MRIINLVVLGTAAISFAVAGQIEIGGNLVGGISNQGLTATYVGVADAGTWADNKTYTTNLFTGDTITPGSSSLGGTNLPTNTAGFQQFTDTNNSVTFAMDTDGGNYWASPASLSVTSSSITIPVGVFDVGGTNILLNDYWGTSNDQDALIQFNFANAGPVQFLLTNGNQIDAIQNCGSTNSPTWANNAHSACTSFAQKTTSSGTDAAWTASYTNTTSGSTPYSGTSGTLNLVDIAFDLRGVTSYSTDTLNSITITDKFNANDTLATDPSRLALSAITVETGSSGPGLTATPEPSTVVMFMTGLGMAGYFGRRRKARP